VSTIAMEYARYAEQVLPVNAGDEQKRETKRAFYAGARSLHLALMQSETEEAALTLCEKLEVEFATFRTAVLEGKA